MERNIVDNKAIHYYQVQFSIPENVSDKLKITKIVPTQETSSEGRNPSKPSFIYYNIIKEFSTIIVYTDTTSAGTVFDEFV